MSHSSSPHTTEIPHKPMVLKPAPITAAGMGSTAAFAIDHDLVNEEIARAVDASRRLTVDAP